MKTMASSSDTTSMALFCDFENIALGVRDAKYEKFDIKPVLERLLANWWEKIGQTNYSGITKLIVAEARNFPTLAAFYYDEVISRARAVVGSVLRRGMACGEFRALEVETTIDVIIAPVLMLLILRHSLACCQAQASDPLLYLRVHMDMLRQGLRKLDKESQV